ncbi:hypothetical protein CRYUN_Cryun12cG0106500 [Craigia yunnanensis]
MVSNLYYKAAVLACEGWSWGCNGLVASTIIRTVTTLMAAALAIVCCTWWARKFTKSKPPQPPGHLEVIKDHDAIFANHDTPTATIDGMYGGHDIVWRPYGPEFRSLPKIVIYEIMSNRSLDASYALHRREIRKW